MDIEKVTAIARICHQANRAICEAFGDHSQQHWEHAPEWQRESAIKGVQFAIDHPRAPVEAQHQSWCDEKVTAGWVHGEVKDPVTRTHPCLVPFHALPPEQQAKDHVFKAIVLAHLD